mgnify:CR=1 FL=1
MEESNDKMPLQSLEEVEVKNEVQTEETSDKSGFIVSPWVLIFALLISTAGDLGLMDLSSHLWITVTATAVLWGIDYIIARQLLKDIALIENGAGTLKFNVYAVVAMGIISTFSSLGLADDNIVNVAVSIAGLAVIPCYALAQIIVAVKLMKDRKAIGLGLSIIAALVVSGAIAYMIEDTPLKKSTEGLYWGFFGAVTVVELLMYYAYYKLFNNIKS